MLATAGALLFGAFGYFVLPGILEKVDRPSAVADSMVHSATTGVSTAVPTAAGLSPLDEPLPAATSKLQRTSLAELTGAGSHVASGTVMVIAVGSTTYIRYERLETANGPDMHVYLSKNLTANSSGVDLGPIKTTSGNVNYEIPAQTTVEEYSYVLMWSKSYGVLFNYAKIW